MIVVDWFDWIYNADIASGIFWLVALLIGLTAGFSILVGYMTLETWWHKRRARKLAAWARSQL